VTLPVPQDHEPRAVPATDQAIRGDHAAAQARTGQPHRPAAPADTHPLPSPRYRKAGQQPWLTTTRMPANASQIRYRARSPGQAGIYLHGGPNRVEPGGFIHQDAMPESYGRSRYVYFTTSRAVAEDAADSRNGRGHGWIHDVQPTGPFEVDPAEPESWKSEVPLRVISVEPGALNGKFPHPPIHRRVNTTATPPAAEAVSVPSSRDHEVREVPRTDQAIRPGVPSAGTTEGRAGPEPDRWGAPVRPGPRATTPVRSGNFGVDGSGGSRSPGRGTGWRPGDAVWHPDGPAIGTVREADGDTARVTFRDICERRVPVAELAAVSPGDPVTVTVLHARPRLGDTRRTVTVFEGTYVGPVPLEPSLSSVRIGGDLWRLPTEYVSVPGPAGQAAALAWSRRLAAAARAALPPGLASQSFPHGAAAAVHPGHGAPASSARPARPAAGRDLGQSPQTTRRNGPR
jgi:hypothetical protein